MQCARNINHTLLLKMTVVSEQMAMLWFYFIITIVEILRLTVVCETKWNETKWNEMKGKSVVCEMKICSLRNGNMEIYFLAAASLPDM